MSALAEVVDVGVHDEGAAEDGVGAGQGEEAVLYINLGNACKGIIKNDSVI